MLLFYFILNAVSCAMSLFSKFPSVLKAVCMQNFQSFRSWLFLLCVITEYYLATLFLNLVILL